MAKTKSSKVSSKTPGKMISTEKTFSTAEILANVRPTPMIKSKLSDDQKKVLTDAALASAKSGSEARLADEASITTSLKERGLTVEAPDLAAFRKAADDVYNGSDLAKTWDKAMLDKVLAA